MDQITASLCKMYAKNKDEFDVDLESICTQYFLYYLSVFCWLEQPTLVLVKKSMSRCIYRPSSTQVSFGS